MKFFLSMVVFALMALVLGLGILLTLKGNPWVLIAGVAGYAILLGTLGCLPPKTSH